MLDVGNVLIQKWDDETWYEWFHPVHILILKIDSAVRQNTHPFGIFSPSFLQQVSAWTYKPIFTQNTTSFQIRHNLGYQHNPLNPNYWVPSIDLL